MSSLLFNQSAGGWDQRLQWDAGTFGSRWGSTITCSWDGGSRSGEIWRCRGCCCLGLGRRGSWQHVCRTWPQCGRSIWMRKNLENPEGKRWKMATFHGKGLEILWKNGTWRCGTCCMTTRHVKSYHLSMEKRTNKLLSMKSMKKFQQISSEPSQSTKTLTAATNLCLANFLHVDFNRNPVLVWTKRRSWGGVRLKWWNVWGYLYIWGNWLMVMNFCVFTFPYQFGSYGCGAIGGSKPQNI